MIAYKFLGEDRLARLSGRTWPEEGFVEAEGSLVVCRNGVHACRVADLPYWLDDRLWEVELDGELIEDRLKLVARRGRLVREVDAWNPTTKREFAEWCLRRVAKHAAEELAEAGIETEASKLEVAETPDEVVSAATSAKKAAQAKGSANAERLSAYAEDAVEWTTALPPSGVAYVAAHTADSRSRSQFADAFAAERALQAQSLAERLGLPRP